MGYHYKELTVIELTAEEFELHKEGYSLELLTNMRNEEHTKYGVVCGRGRNPTLRLWPAIFSGEIDVFPSERRNMGQEIGR